MKAKRKKSKLGGSIRKNVTVGALALVVIGAVVQVAVGQFMPGTMAHLFDAFHKKPVPPEERIIQDVTESIRSGSGWQGKPVIYDESQEYMRQHFQELSPAYYHLASSGGKVDEIIQIPKLVSEAKLHAGKLLSVSGYTTQIQKMDQKGDSVVWLLQIHSIQDLGTTGLVYCYTTAPGERDFKNGELVNVNLVILGGGNMENVNRQSSTTTIPTVWGICPVVMRAPQDMLELVMQVETDAQDESGILSEKGLTVLKELCGILAPSISGSMALGVEAVREHTTRSVLDAGAKAKLLDDSEKIAKMGQKISRLQPDDRFSYSLNCPD